MSFTKNCLVCGNSFTRDCQRFKYCSHTCEYKTRKGRKGFWRGKKRPEMSKLHKGEGNPQWKGDLVSKKGIHLWLRTNFGRPEYCETCKSTTAIRYDWALKTGLGYERKKQNFLRLCRSCHMKYDYASKVRSVYIPTAEVRKKISNTLLSR